jgi:mannan endo-1,4-beta-mannosidase
MDAINPLKARLSSSILLCYPSTTMAAILQRVACHRESFAITVPKTPADPHSFHCSHKSIKGQLAMQRKTLAAIFVFLFLFVVPAAAQLPAANPDPVNPHASPEARALLKYLYSISGKYTLAGQHNFPNHISRWTDRAYDLTGKYPALFGQDFGFSGGDDKDSIEARPALVKEAERQYQNGAVVTLTWHAVRPTDDEPVTFRDSVQGHLTDFEWNELLTPGTDLYNRWCAQVDVIAGYLKQLQDAHVPVLFRAYHEMNGGWFWWGGRPGKNGSAALYRQLFDRFVNYHKLNNIIWVWNVNSPNPTMAPIPEYFPGTQYVDLLTEDIYGKFEQSYYNDMLTLAAGKPIALGEVGAVPAPEVLAQQPKWIYFMVWSNLVEFANPVANLQAIYNDPNVLTRDYPHSLASIIKTEEPEPDTAKPVSPHATPEAESLLARLYAASGRSVLSGQENNPQTVGGSTNNVFEITAKHPAIYSQDLGIAKEAGTEIGVARAAIVEEAKREYHDHAIISLTWHATRPTDDEPGSSEHSVQGQLTDFEWNELLTPGTHLYQRWCDQVDLLAKSLKSLQDAHVAVLWRPYPEANGKKYWWAGRKGIHGSAALYRQLFDRLANLDGVDNLVWMWEAVAPGFGPTGNGSYNDFFPGLLYVDGLSVDIDDLGSRFRSDTFLSLIGGDKVIGLELTGKIPGPEVFAQQTKWTWFLISPDAVSKADQADALRKLYNDPRVVSRE